jgi:hypothetical protein
MVIRWGRRNRGRVWHLVDSFLVPWCDDADPAVETTEELPPAGAVVCRRCSELAEHVGVMVINAVYRQRESQDGGETDQPKLLPTEPTED